MLSSFASQIDTLQIQKKQAEAKAALSIFCSNAETSTHEGNVHWTKIQSAPFVIKIMKLNNVLLYQESRKHYKQLMKKMKLSIC